jgi:hypothetical protein
MPVVLSRRLARVAPLRVPCVMNANMTGHILPNRDVASTAYCRRESSGRQNHRAACTLILTIGSTVTV